MDKFRGILREEARGELEPTTYEPSSQERVELDKRYTKYAFDQIHMRMDLIEKEMRGLDRGHFDACVAVAKNNLNSIERLNQVTLENVKDERLRLLYIATQTASINLKISAAIGEVMKIYRRVLGTASTLSFLPMASSTNRPSSAISICKAIVQCFGLPTINYDTVFEIVKSTVWDDAGHNMLIALGEAAATVGVLATVACGGMPIFLATGAFNFPLVVPATTRLILMLASDLILILARAFRITTTTCVGQPSEKDTNVVKSFRYKKVRLGLEEIVERFKGTNISTLDQSDQGNRESLASNRTEVDKEVGEMTILFSESRAEVNEKTEQIQETIAAKLSLESSESDEESDEESSSR
ncbi:MAG: hypothetical protein Q9167_004070 [Letrouitia subvulpina]